MAHQLGPKSMEDEDTLKQQNKPHKLKCSVHNYDWGRIGEESEVARLFSLNSGFEIQADKPYAELWMGTHESGPSFVKNGEEFLTLKSLIEQNPNLIGEKVLEEFGTDLPFLFKVLSVAKALSIQAHPDKELAATLHKLNPSVYKDGNHKPEMALAITEFEALCGFVSLRELKDVLHSVPEIVELVGDTDANHVLQVNEQDGEEKVKATLRSIFTRLMSASTDIVSETVSKMKSRLTMENEGVPEILPGTPLDSYTKRYSPPFNEFEVDCCILPQGASTTFPAIGGPSLFVVTAGEGLIQADSSSEEVRKGSVLFVPAETGTTVASFADLQLYRAGVNSRFL